MEADGVENFADGNEIVSFHHLRRNQQSNDSLLVHVTAQKAQTLLELRGGLQPNLQDLGFKLEN